MARTGVVSKLREKWLSPSRSCRRVKASNVRWWRRILTTTTRCGTGKANTRTGRRRGIRLGTLIVDVWIGVVVRGVCTPLLQSHGRRSMRKLKRYRKCQM